MLNADKANGYWSPRVLLSLGHDIVDEAHSITSRVAYWARAKDALDPG